MASGAETSAGEGPLPVFVYTQGKSASTTVELAIRAAGLTCHKIHSLERNWLLQVTREAVAAGRFPPRHICTAMGYREGLVSGGHAGRFVTLVRDPVAQALSAFFENLHRRRDGLTDKSPPEALIERFLAEAGFPRRLAWFDTEFKAQLGIDVMAAPFNRQKRVLRMPRRRLVVLRTDCPDQIKERVLSQMLGRPITLKPRNVSAEKPYAAAYATLRASLVLPAETADLVYESAYARCFWTDEERALLRAWWLDPALGRADGKRDPL